MLIGVDLDEVLADLLSAFIRYHNDKYGTSLDREGFHSYDLWKAWGGTREDAVQKVKDFYKTKYFKNITPLSGSVRGIDILCKTNELIVITSRPSYVEEETKEWINYYFPDKFSDIYFVANPYQPGIYKRKKSDICRELGVDVFIEDCFNYARDCANNGTHVFLFDSPWNRSGKLPTGVVRVKSWGEIVKRCQKMYLNIETKKFN